MDNVYAMHITERFLGICSYLPRPSTDQCCFLSPLSSTVPQRHLKERLAPDGSVLSVLALHMLAKKVQYGEGVSRDAISIRTCVEYVHRLDVGSKGVKEEARETKREVTMSRTVRRVATATARSGAVSMNALASALALAQSRARPATTMDPAQREEPTEAARTAMAESSEPAGIVKDETAERGERQEARSSGGDATRGDEVASSAGGVHEGVNEDAAPRVDRDRAARTLNTETVDHGHEGGTGGARGALGAASEGIGIEGYLHPRGGTLVEILTALGDVLSPLDFLADAYVRNAAFMEVCMAA